jgi:hypothetical protein
VDGMWDFVTLVSQRSEEILIVMFKPDELRIFVS